MAPSTSSRGDTSPERTSSACAVASRCGSMVRERNWPRGQGLSSESRPGFGTFHPMEPTSTASRQGKSGSLANPEVLENVPGHLIPIIEREFDDFDNEAEKFLSGELEEMQFIGFRLKQGVYGQRKANVQMIRIKLPLGGIAPGQMDAFASVVEKYAPLN